MEIKQLVQSQGRNFACIIYLVIAIITYNHSLHSITALKHVDNSLKTVDFIIFSYDRPMQLYALLESIENNLTGLESTSVIYRASDDRFTNGYKELEQRFAGVKFIKQGNNPAHDFKPLVLEAFKAGKAPYICFAVDDIIVKNHADLTEATQALVATGAYGFFLRLGTHLTTCYSENKNQPLPPLSTLPNSMYLWALKDGIHDWGFAHTVDMTIYKKSDIIQDFITMNYTNPNKLEGIWSHNTQKSLSKKGLCYTNSIVVNIPTNLVQDVCNNRHMNSWTTEQLLEKFNLGQKIDISTLHGINNESCHIAYALTFINR
jgi:hypothetical protein